MMTTLLSLALLWLSATCQPGYLSLEELERLYGPNILVPDPAGLGPPKGVADDLVLQRWLGDEPKLLNALVINDGNLTDSLLAYVVVDPALRHRDQPSRWAPGSADYVSISDDLRTVTVRLKRGLRWQFPLVDREDPRYAWLLELFKDGAPEFTSADIQFTHSVTMDENSNAGHLRAVLDGSSIEVLDRYTFQMHWDRQFVYALDKALAWEQILPEFLYSRAEDGTRFEQEERGAALNTHWYNDRLCGFGPYEFTGRDPGVEIVLTRKEDFPLFRPAVKEMHWQATRDSESAALRLLEGKLDFTVLMPQQYRKYYLEAPADSPFRQGRLTVQHYEKMEYVYLAWNNRRPQLADPRVRRALGMAFNRKAFLEKIFMGLGDLVDSHVFYRHPHFNPDAGALPFDLEAASELLDQAGWGDSDGDGVRDRLVRVTSDGALEEQKVDLSISVLTFAGSHEFEAMLAIYQQDLRGIGVEMTPEPVTWNRMQQSAFKDRDYDCFTGLISLNWNLDFYPAFHSEGASNYSGFGDPEADKLIVRYRETIDDSERRRIAFRIQEILFEQQPYTWFMRRERATAYPSWLKNVHFSVARPQLLSFGWYRSD